LNDETLRKWPQEDSMVANRLVWCTTCTVWNPRNRTLGINMEQTMDPSCSTNIAQRHPACPIYIHVLNHNYVTILHHCSHVMSKWAPDRHQSTYCNRNGYPKQYIRFLIVKTIFTYRFHFGLPGTCLSQSLENTPFWRQGVF